MRKSSANNLTRCSVVSTHMQQGGLDHFPQLFNLLLASTNITVGHVRLLLNLQHERVLQLV